jgi:phage tail protein X
MQVRAHQGDSLDSLCYRHLGSSAYVESALDLNPGLAALGPILPNGQLVTLPEESANAPASSKILQLWD